jgi:hypothetical protein
MQDIPSRYAAKPGKRPARAAAGAGARSTGAAADDAGVERRERLRVLLLGANLWVLCVLWPAWSAHAPARGVDVAFETLGLLPLALGAALGRARDGTALSALRPALLLVVFPAALCAALALRGEPLNQQLFGPFALCLLALSLCAYGAAVASSLAARGDALRPKHVALGEEPWDAAPPARELPRRVFVGAFVAGAAAIAFVAPRLGGPVELERAWGDAAAAGGVLTAVVGAALAVTLLAVHLADGLRAPPPRAPEGDPGLRTAWFLFLALLGAVTFFVVQP